MFEPPNSCVGTPKPSRVGLAGRGFGKGLVFQPLQRGPWGLPAPPPSETLPEHASANRESGPQTLDPLVVVDLQPAKP